MAATWRRRPAGVSPRQRYGLLAGGAGGLLGGVLMAALLMATFPAAGLGTAFRPIMLIGAVLDQNWGASTGFVAGPFAAGILIHLAVSVLAGAAFAWLVNYTTGPAVVLAAAVWSLLLWLAGHLALLPVFDPVAARHLPLWLFALGHLTYGLALGAFVAVTRRPVLPGLARGSGEASPRAPHGLAPLPRRLPRAA